MIIFGVSLMCTAAESPWSNGICERLNCIIGISVQKIMSDTKCNLTVALSWAVSARNALQSVHGYSPNQLVFGHNPSFPNVVGNEPPALEQRIPSQIISDNLNAMHAARKDFICNESSERIRRALLRQVREDDISDVNTGDSVYYKRVGEDMWRGPVKLIGRDGKEVLVKHGGYHVKVHTCRLQKSAIASPSLEMTTINPESVPAPDTSASGLVKSAKPLSLDDTSDEEEIGEENDVTEELEETEEGDQGVRADISRDSNSDTLDNFKLAGEKIPSMKKGNRIEYYDLDGDKNVCQILSRAGKAGGGYQHCYNIRDQHGNIKWVDLSRTVEKWRQLPEEEAVLLCDGSSDDIFAAKLAEMEIWKKNDVFEKVQDCGQPTISVRWVITEKMKEGSPVIKARLVARGFEEDLSGSPTDSPTCSRDALRISLAFIASKRWKCFTVDIKAAFLQGKPIERNVFVRPPKEFNDGQLWKLKKNVYGLNDAAKAWYCKLRELLLSLGMKISSLDSAVFYWIRDGLTAGVMCIHVDDILLAGTRSFHTSVVAHFKRKVLIGSSSESCSFKYLGINIVQTVDGIGLHQKEYVDAISEISLSRERASRRMDNLQKEEMAEYRSLIGQLNWLGTQTRPDIAFDVCDLSANLKLHSVEDVLKANRTIKK